MTINHLLTRRLLAWALVALVTAALLFIAVRAAVGREGLSREPGIVAGDSTIVATVNGVDMELGWVRRLIAAHGRTSVAARMDPDDWRRLSVINAVRNSAAHAEALARGYVPDLEAIDAFVNKQRAACEENIVRCTEGAADLGMTVDEHYDNMREALPRENLIGQLREAVGANWGEYIDGKVDSANIEWRDEALRQDFEAGWPDRARLQAALKQAHEAEIEAFSADDLPRRP